MPQTLSVTTDAPVRTLLAGVVETPAGPLALVVSADGVVHAAGYGDLDALVARLAATDRTVDATGGVRRVTAEELPPSVTDAVGRYSAGDPTALDAVPVQQPGGPFSQAAWAAMRRIPAGETLTYTELAAMAGNAGAVRAAGSACARNLVAPFIPCHRVVRTDGSLGGYAYGLDVKRRLLAHERGEVLLG
ncbi:methylated-DNA--[protein]-cysteine S-methyltransferase [Actinotalea subterranea]|uniref:methylated-DNA--[protein]-cysteine S-methyltransferase n=1 Tax=Actinotalea subterranea TaxID=2607497 RepID=UPI0011EE2031|nr:methylated-DNA--[protein]-cysteine S-methyltransferase [Actinotalea subterranea]